MRLGSLGHPGHTKLKYIYKEINFNGTKQQFHSLPFIFSVKDKVMAAD